MLKPNLENLQRPLNLVQTQTCLTIPTLCEKCHKFFILKGCQSRSRLKPHNFVSPESQRNMDKAQALKLKLGQV
jgi:hypothetical protein